MVDLLHLFRYLRALRPRFFYSDCPVSPVSTGAGWAHALHVRRHRLRRTLVGRDRAGHGYLASGRAWRCDTSREAWPYRGVGPSPISVALAVVLVVLIITSDFVDESDRGASSTGRTSRTTGPCSRTGRRFPTALIESCGGPLTHPYIVHADAFG